MRSSRQIVLVGGSLAALGVMIWLLTLRHSSTADPSTGARHRSASVPDAAGEKVALLLVDVQRDFWTPDLASEFPEFERNVGALVDLCRERGIEVVHVRTQYDPDLDNWSPRFVPVHRSSRLCLAGSDGARPLECAAEQEGEPIFVKGHLDGFTGTELGRHLQRSGAGHVMIAGLYTDVCVLSTALSAFNRGYGVTLLEDCCAAPRSAHDFIIDRYDGFFLNCLPHETLTYLLDDAGD